MLESLSDKAVLERARGGSEEAVMLLAKRFGLRINDPRAMIMAFRLPKFLSVSAAKRILQVMLHSDLNATRWTLGVAELLWAVTLLWPGDTFGRPTYSVMSHVMREEAWGFVFLLSGVTQFAILFQGRYHDRFPIMFAAWNSALWWYVVISMYLSVTPPPAAISGELALAMAAGWVWMRSGYIIHGGRRSTDRE